MIFAIHQHDSAMGAHVSLHPEPPSHLPPHPISVLCQSTSFECPSPKTEKKKNPGGKETICGFKKNSVYKLGALFVPQVILHYITLNFESCMATHDWPVSYSIKFQACYCIYCQSAFRVY